MSKHLEALQEAVEYFDGKADAEYLPGRASPVGNREMQLVGEMREAAQVASQLLAALEAVEAAWLDGLISHPEFPIRQVRAAIAKAEGRS